jgi:NDP-mannose synthase
MDRPTMGSFTPTVSPFDDPAGGACVRPEPVPSKVRQAIVLAGGRGTRLHPYSASLPRPLMPLGDITVLELLLHRFARSGLTDALLLADPGDHLIKAHMGAGEKFGLRITYAPQSGLLGGAGALAGLLDDLDEHFFVSNGDLLSTLHLDRMAAQHMSIGADATIAGFRRAHRSEPSVLEVDDQSRLLVWREKQESEQLVSMGVCILRRDAVIPHVGCAERLEMPELLRRLKAARADVRCYREECVWLDVGRLEDFALAQIMFRDDPGLFYGE